MANDRELFTLACRRYPGDAAMAVMQFASDRRRAGLGALDIAKRRTERRKPIRHTKEFGMDGRVYYKSVLDIQEQWIYPPCPPSLSAFEASLTIQVERRPAVRQVRVLPIEFRKFQGQRDRHGVAMLLRELRKGLRAAASIGKAMPAPGAVEGGM